MKHAGIIFRLKKEVSSQCPIIWLDVYEWRSDHLGSDFKNYMVMWLQVIIKWAKCPCSEQLAPWLQLREAGTGSGCMKLADLSQTIWLILSHSGRSEQGVEGRDRWHNGCCQTCLKNAQTICGDNPDAIRAITAPHSAHKQTQPHSQKESSQLSAFCVNMWAPHPSHHPSHPSHLCSL